MSKIIMCCPFYNENLVASVYVKEGAKWADEIHITECNKTFKYGNHDYCFHLDEPNDKVFYHQLDGNKFYLEPIKKSIFTLPHLIIKPVSRWMKHYYYNTAWYNEGVSRNHTLWNVDYNDDDILILSDIDEIIDSRYADEIVSEVRKRGIVTVKIHFTMFYFNLFCKQWAKPEGFSYRVFAVRGDVMRKSFYNDSDFLRKQGEWSKLLDKVYCLDGYKGFHHSWLGDEEFVANKIMSYAHSTDDHKNGIIGSDGKPNIDVIKDIIKRGDSLFDNVHLQIDNEIELMPSVELLRTKESIHFIK